jgi:hypothetical protein
MLSSVAVDESRPDSAVNARISARWTAVSIVARLYAGKSTLTIRASSRGNQPYCNGMRFALTGLEEAKVCFPSPRSGPFSPDTVSSSVRPRRIAPMGEEVATSASLTAAIG